MRTPNRVTKPSPLFSLPREIRDQIYECVYPSRTHLPVTRFIWRNANYLEVEKAIFALRLVNRQVSVEATFHFYSSSIFYGESFNLLYFLERIGERRELIKWIELKNLLPDPTDDNQDEEEACVSQLFEKINGLPTLQTITIQIIEDDLEGIWARLSGWNIWQVNSHVEIVVRNRSFRDVNRQPLFNDRRHEEVRPNVSIWRRARGATEWRTDEHDHGGEDPQWFDFLLRCHSPPLKSRDSDSLLKGSRRQGRLDSRFSAFMHSMKRLLPLKRRKFGNRSGSDRFDTL